MEDRCSCAVKCKHGDRCLGGHAAYPDEHWYPCPKCTPTQKVPLRRFPRRGQRPGPGS